MPLPQEKRYTYADVLTWDESVRVELIEGYPLMMSSPGVAHQRAAIAISSQLYDYLKGKKCEVFSAPFDIRLFEKEGDYPEGVDTVVQPDITVVCDPSKLDEYGCKGAPDMVVEVLSPSTKRHDMITKFNLYQRAGVREYWIVNPGDKLVQVFLFEDGRCTAKELGEGKSKVKVNVLEDCYIDLSLVFPE